jgi:hypothetical protein
MTKRRGLSSKIGSCLLLLLVALALMAGAVWGIWELVSTYVPPGWTRAWALIATVLLPMAFGIGYNLGLTESRGKLRGIDAGIERVTRAAAAAIDLRATSARKMRQAQREPPVVLPPLPGPTIIERPQIESGEIVEW